MLAINSYMPRATCILEFGISMHSACPPPHPLAITLGPIDQGTSISGSLVMTLGGGGGGGGGVHGDTAPTSLTRARTMYQPTTKQTNGEAKH